MSTVRAVLWDMDGTLIDSEEFHWISWRETLQKEGVTITREQFLATFGQRNDSIIPQLLGTMATPERIEKVSTAKEKLYRDLVRRHGMKPLPGVAVWLERLHETGWLQAIGSAAPCANIEVVLEALSAAHLFQAIVSAEDVQHGKPDPQVYLVAASRLGALPERSIRRGRRRCGSTSRTSRRHAQHRRQPQRKAAAGRYRRAVARATASKRIRSTFDS